MISAPNHPQTSAITIMIYLQGKQTDRGRTLLIEEHGQGPSNHLKVPFGPPGCSPTWASYIPTYMLAT